MFDVVVIGAGAAGLATGIFAARAGAGQVLCLEGAKRIGAKILVSGGRRCNVTNREVSARDFWGSSPRLIRDVLRAFPAPRTVEFFAAEGVALHEEEDGKLFPDSNRSRDVVDALLRAAASAGVDVRSGCRVQSVRPSPVGPNFSSGTSFEITTTDGQAFEARAIVLATGGQSLPKSGSDGFGYSLARSLGHSIVETTPALAPLLVDDDVCARLSGVAHPAELQVRAAGKQIVALNGSLLWTHFGISGPLALNASRHWLRARMGATDVELRLNLCPGDSFEDVEGWFLDRQSSRPKAFVASVVAERVPQAVADAWVARAGIDASETMSHLDRDARRRLVHALVDTVLRVRDSRGYAYAEVTAGGVPLAEVNTATMESKKRPGLYLVGEILDVDGRLGGFNFQWSWSSAFVAGTALGRRAEL